MKTKTPNYFSNIWKIGTSMVSVDFTFALGVFVVFMLLIGLSLGEVSIVIAAYLLFYSIGQIPSGIFADRYGYKTSMIIGAFLFLGGTIFFAFSQGFYWFLIGNSLMGLGAAMKQGADSALLYEGLKSDDKENLFKKIAGKVDFHTNIFWVVTATIGGYLYSVNARLPFYAEIVLATIVIIIIFTIKEPKKEAKHFPVWTQVKNSMNQAFNTPNFSKIFIYSALIGSIAVIAFQYLQPLYKSLEINVIYFGLIAAGTYVFRGIGAWFAEKVGKMFSIDKYLVLHATIFGLFLVLLQKTSSLFLVFPIIAVFYFLRGLYAPTISTYINNKVDSSNRATILSVNSQLLAIFTSISLFITGFIASKYDLSTTFSAISISSIVFLILYVLTLKNVKAG